MKSAWPSMFLVAVSVFLLVLAGFPQTQSPAAQTPETLGLAFVDGSSSKVILERDGKKYLVDLSTRTVQEMSDLEADGHSGAGPSGPSDSSSTSSSRSMQAGAPPAETKPTATKIYKPGDDELFSLPTGRRLDRHGLYINFTHRFPYETAFTDPARGATLFGLDNFSVSSFGIRYGVTSRLFVMAYRSPSIIGRPIELMAGYSLLDEKDGQPFNAAFRFSVDGQNNFQRNFTENFELTLSRSITHRAQLYLVPTYSIHNRPLLQASSTLNVPFPYQPCSAANAAGLDPSFHAKPCADTFSLGVGASVDVRPTVALIAETIPTLVNGADLGIHRPEFAFGIQKKIWRHAFTFGFTNGPGTLVSERAGTRATFLGDSTADKASKMFVGFDLTRQVF